MTTEATVVLFRPVGQKELDLIRDSGWKRFPPRLSWQPIFYPVLTEDYAISIARDWNSKDAKSGHVGYVLRFRVLKSYMDRHQPHKVGGSKCWEYWIPAEELGAFNDNIVGTIEVIHEFRPSGTMNRDLQKLLQQLNCREVPKDVEKAMVSRGQESRDFLWEAIKNNKLTKWQLINCLYLMVKVGRPEDLDHFFEVLMDHCLDQRIVVRTLVFNLLMYLIYHPAPQSRAIVRAKLAKGGRLLSVMKRAFEMGPLGGLSPGDRKVL